MQKGKKKNKKWNNTVILKYSHQKINDKKTGPPKCGPRLKTYLLYTGVQVVVW